MKGVLKVHRKQYEFIAKSIKDNTLKDTKKMLPTLNKVNLVSALCVLFSKDNIRFNHDKFINACD